MFFWLVGQRLHVRSDGTPLKTLNRISRIQSPHTANSLSFGRWLIRPLCGTKNYWTKFVPEIKIRDENKDPISLANSHCIIVLKRYIVLKSRSPSEELKYKCCTHAGPDFLNNASGSEYFVDQFANIEERFCVKEFEFIPLS